MPLFLGNEKISKVTVAFDGSGAASGIDTNDATLTSGNQMLKGVSAYSKGKKYTGTIPTVEAPTPDISVSGNGIITATVSNSKGYQASATTKTSTQQLTTQGEKVITPNDSTQTAVNAGVYTTGPITVSAVPAETKTITANGVYSPSAGKYFSSVEVAIAGDTPTYQSKTVSPSTSIQTVTADEGYDALIDVTVNAIQTETKNITTNGTYNPTSGKYFSSVTVNVPAEEFNTQTKTVTPTESEQVISPDAGYDGLSSVTVGAISSTYIGSGITRKAATVYTPTENKQIINAGQYLNGDQTISAIPSTYVGSAIPTQGTKTVTPSTSIQTAVPSGTYVTGDVKVSAMPTGALSTPTINTSTGVVTSGVATAGYLAANTTKTLQLTAKSAATITPSTTNQTIAAGQYLTGIQTIQGDSNLIPENIASGVSIFGVTGTHESNIGVDTSDATATANDIENGKTAYVKGQKITGNLPLATGVTMDKSYATVAWNNGDIQITGENASKYILSSSATVTIPVSGDKFGNATADNVIAGNTFTSTAGLKVAGTLVVHKYYTGDTAPSNSFGNDGDLYLQA